MQVLATSARMIVQDCVEAEENVDARDQFFMYPVAMADIRVCVGFAWPFKYSLLHELG